MKTLKIIPLLILAIFGSCAYYNTFFNAEDNFRQGIEKLDASSDKKISPAIRTNFEAAITKSWRVISVYGDSNSWADDALFLIGKSHYYLEEFEKSKEILENFLQKYLKSPLIADVELWLARSFLMLNDPEQATQILEDLISKAENDDIKAAAYQYLGDIYYDQKDFESSIKNYSNCLEYSDSDEISGNAQYKLADSYFNLKDYQKASEEYKAVLYYDLPVLKQFDAILQMVNSLMQLEEFSEAEAVLNNTLRDIRFQNQFSVIAAKLANIIEFQGEIDYAIEKYREVVETYPKTEGAALASFYLAQIYEFEYGILDSAKIKYDDVPKQYNRSPAAADAAKRSAVLATYLNIKNGLINDHNAMYKLLHGDSLIVDSLVTGHDTILVSNTIQSDTSYVFNTDPGDVAPAEIIQDIPFGTTGQEDLANSKTGIQNQQEQSSVIKEQKVAVYRDPEEIEKSLLKNSYNLAEFFLLTYEHYDSAKYAYHYFIDNFYDSLLTPKAHYSLYYIYSLDSLNKVKADSFKTIILNSYPNTVYSKKLSGKITPENNEMDPVKEKYLAAEELFELKKYEEAINLFNNIADSDSSVWVVKSLYAISYINEYFVKDDSSAFRTYKILAQKFPETEQGKVALKKIKTPPPARIETAPDSVKTTTANDSINTDLIELVPKDSVDKNIDLQEKTVIDSL
jgi:TolA-binding protein